MRRFRAGAVVVASDLALPLDAAPIDASARLRLLAGAPADTAAGWTRIETRGVGAAWIDARRGAHLVLDDGAPAAAVQGFVQGLVVPTALQLDGAFVVHAAAAVVDGGAVALVGPSGAGKSALVAALARAGFGFFGDDSLVVTATEHAADALVGSAPLRLTVDVARWLGLDAGALPRCPISDKRYVEPGAIGAVAPAGRHPLRAIYHLQRTANAASCRPLPPADAAVELLAAEMHPTPDARPPDDERRRFDAAVAIARRAPSRRLAVPDGLARLDEAVAALVDEVRSGAR